MYGMYSGLIISLSFCLPKTPFNVNIGSNIFVNDTIEHVLFICRCIHSTMQRKSVSEFRHYTLFQTICIILVGFLSPSGHFIHTHSLIAQQINDSFIYIISADNMSMSISASTYFYHLENPIFQTLHTVRFYEKPYIILPFHFSLSLSLVINSECDGRCEKEGVNKNPQHTYFTNTKIRRRI